MGFYLGKEAVPRHRLQALLARGEFDRALDLARTNSMDEVDVHAARLLALMREGGGAGGVGIGGGVGVSHVLSDGTLSPTFFEDVRGLFEKLDSPAALGRACEAAVRTPLPSLGDVRKLLEVWCGMVYVGDTTTATLLVGILFFLFKDMSRSRAARLRLFWCRESYGPVLVFRKTF